MTGFDLGYVLQKTGKALDTALDNAPLIGSAYRGGKAISEWVQGSSAEEVVEAATPAPLTPVPDPVPKPADVVTTIVDAASNAGQAAADIISAPFKAVEKLKQYALPLAIGAGALILFSRR